METNKFKENSTNICCKDKTIFVFIYYSHILGGENMNTPVLLLGDPLLRQKSVTINDLSNPKLKKEIKELKEALNQFRKENGFGRGIAAIQIGISKRLIALNLGKETFVIVNPEITYRSKETFTMWDDCMSFPDLVVKVRRHITISLKYQNEEGTIKEWSNIGQAESELLQHEIDHLDGIMAIDRAIDTKGIIYKTEYHKNKKMYESQCDYTIVPTIAN